MKTIGDITEEFTVDDAIDKLIVLNKIEKARNEIKAGKGLTTAQAKEKLAKWLK